MQLVVVSAVIAAVMAAAMICHIFCQVLAGIYSTTCGRISLRQRRRSWSFATDVSLYFCINGARSVQQNEAHLRQALRLVVAPRKVLIPKSLLLFDSYL